MTLFFQYAMTIARYGVVLLSAAIIIRSIRSMLSERYEPETWAYIKRGGTLIPVTHWENIIGRSPFSDIRIDHRSMSRVHAVLTRSDNGVWRIYDIFSRGGVWVNDSKVGINGTSLRSRDVLSFGGSTVLFYDISTEQKKELEERRTKVGARVSPAVTLLELTLFEICLLIEQIIYADDEYTALIAVAFAGLIALQWMCYYLMCFMGRSGFEVETLAFYLSSLGLSVAASSVPEDMLQQLIFTIVGVAMFLFGGLWLRKLKRTYAMRIPVGILALLLLAVNVIFSDAVLGAKNWLSIGGFSFQPSEFVKVLYVYVGASTLDRLYRRQNLYSFIFFSACCVVALALIGDFGTALIFFASFLVISFMRSGSIATVMLAVTGAGLAGVLAISVKPHIASRFAIWGHVWEDIYDKGYQQTRAMSAAASGGLFGKGAGNGWLHTIFAANTDMVFAEVCEELGLMIGLCMVLAVLTLAFFAVRSARSGRSAFYSIAACAAMSMMLVQMGLNVFGSLDILPFTGVTFPFVSRGGSSLLSCWMMMGYIKAADTRRGSSFAVRDIRRIDDLYGDDDDDYYDDDEDNGEEKH
ncbi:MAG: FtsW/RodA/SpoVE family cell cycle protein [Eubacteriales bacterium]|nr:FtsW/RodA/SpoVE family cell cycle protein [Eubacteriales bacterium]